jgi:hypothetical protein
MSLIVTNPPVPPSQVGLYDSASIQFLSSGSAPTYGWATRTAAAKLSDILGVKDAKDSSGSGVSGDGVTDDATGINAVITTAGGGPLEFPFATYLVSALTALTNSKIYGRGSLLKPSTNSMAVLGLTGTLTLASGDFQLVRDLRIEGSGKTGITGVKAVIAGGQSSASLILENVYVLNCDTIDFDLENAQFIRTHNLRSAVNTSATGVGMLIKNIAVDGGGNSHDHYGLHVYQKEVGVVVNGTAFSVAVAHNFYNPQILSNSVCGMAFFSAKSVVYGGAPETNATGAATRVVDGQTVKKSSMYLNNSDVRVCDMTSAESLADPCFLIESSSKLTLRNFTGYGNGGAAVLLVSADVNSTVHLEGMFAGQATVQNVVSWPDSWILPAAAQCCLFGEPVHTIDPTLPVMYAEQATAWANGAGASPPSSNVFAEDANLSYSRTIVFLGVVGSASTEVSVAKTTFTNQAASQDTVFSFLVKANKDCQIFLHLHDGTNYNALNPTQINLKTNKVTKVLVGKRNLPTGGSGTWTFYVGPNDTTAPTLVISNLQVYQGATGTSTTSRDIAKIIKLGAFYPGVTRETQANLRLLAASVNATAKYPGKQVWDTTNNRVVFAAGQSAASVWVDGVTTTVHTPV